MAVLAGAVAFLGLAFLVVAGVFALMAWGAWRRHRLVARTPSRPVAQWRAGARGPAVEGLLAPGPGGALIAPFSGEACVWYHAELLATVDPGDQGGQTTHTVWQLTSAPPALQDGTGTLLIDSSLLREEGVSDLVVEETRTHQPWEWTAGRFSSAWEGLPPEARGLPRYSHYGRLPCEEFSFSERLVREGAPLTVVGGAAVPAAAGLMVVKRRMPATIVGPLPRADLLAAFRRTLREERGHAFRFALAGLVLMAVGIPLAVLMWSPE